MTLFKFLPNSVKTLLNPAWNKSIDDLTRDAEFAMDKVDEVLEWMWSRESSARRMTYFEGISTLLLPSSFIIVYGIPDSSMYQHKHVLDFIRQESYNRRSKVRVYATEKPSSPHDDFFHLPKVSEYGMIAALHSQPNDHSLAAVLWNKSAFGRSLSQDEETLKLIPAEARNLAPLSLELYHIPRISETSEVEYFHALNTLNLTLYSLNRRKTKMMMKEKNF